MRGLPARDLRGVLALLADLAETTSVADFAGMLTASICHLIPCDRATYNEVHREARRVPRGADPEPPEQATIATHADANHVLTIDLEARDGAPRAVLALYRRRPDFSERQRTLLEALRPHLTSAYRSVEARQILHSVEQTMDRQGCHALLVDRTGAIRHASPGAGRCLERHFGRPAHSGVLPAALATPLRRDWTSGPLAAETAATASQPSTRRLTVEVTAVNAWRAAILLQEQPAISPDALARLGLTPREAEVLACLANGWTNREIAGHLWISGATVKKHLEHIYDRLGVRTRTAAAAVALQAG